ncbi:hypothetical protein LEP1GSC165_3835 [Leptospira santarosai str. CBC523]|nr:hypothetical protein LEP1GSC165_3835 [Leptospira santarosai str. CBC523]
MSTSVRQIVDENGLGGCVSQMKRSILYNTPKYGRYPSFLLSKEYTIAAVVLQPNCNTIKTDTRILENIKEPGLYFPQCLYDRIFLETLFVLQKDKNDFSNSKGEFFSRSNFVGSDPKSRESKRRFCNSFRQIGLSFLFFILFPPFLNFVEHKKHFPFRHSKIRIPNRGKDWNRTDTFWT